jgi:hypothetical protein
MAKLEDILKGKGYSDSDLATVLGPLDAKAREALEGAYGVVESELNTYRAENDGWAKWHEEHGKPTLALYEKDMIEAKAEAAALKARLAEAEKNGFAPASVVSATSATNAPPGATDPNAWDARKHNVPTWDDVKKLADAEGQAIAMAADLAEEYRQLTGKSIYDYSYKTPDGRELRGMTAIRTEAQYNRQPNMFEYANKKFNFEGLRNQAAEAARLKHEEAIRADERAKVSSQYGDPNTRPLMPSKDPFIPAPRQQGVQPWDVPETDRRKARLDRAFQNQMRGAIQ